MLGTNDQGSGRLILESSRRYRRVRNMFRSVKINTETPSHTASGQELISPANETRALTPAALIATRMCVTVIAAWYTLGVMNLPLVA
jgi:hypothetical protein